MLYKHPLVAMVKKIQRKWISFLPNSFFLHCIDLTVRLKQIGKEKQLLRYKHQKTCAGAAFLYDLNCTGIYTHYLNYVFEEHLIYDLLMIPFFLQPK